MAGNIFFVFQEKMKICLGRMMGPHFCYTIAWPTKRKCFQFRYFTRIIDPKDQRFGILSSVMGFKVEINPMLSKASGVYEYHEYEKCLAGTCNMHMI